MSTGDGQATTGGMHCERLHRCFFGGSRAGFSRSACLPRVAALAPSIPPHRNPACSASPIAFPPPPSPQVVQEIKDLVLGGATRGSPGDSPRGSPAEVEVGNAAASSADPAGSHQGRAPASGHRSSGASAPRSPAAGPGTPVAHALTRGLRGSPGGTAFECAETQLAAAPDLCTLSHWLDEGLPEHLFF